MNFLILAAAGSGQRFGRDFPKQFSYLDNRPLYQHSLMVLAPLCASGRIVVPTEWVSRIEPELESLFSGNRFQAIAGGATRQDSVWHGLRSLPASEGLVLVHDAARPHVSRELASRVLATAERYGACVPGVPIPDTIKEVEGSRVARTLERSKLRAVQTPQAFHLSLLKTAFEKAIKEGFQGTDEATLVERLGGDVEMIPGEAGNFKITWPEDLPAEGRASNFPRDDTV